MSEQRTFDVSIDILGGGEGFWSDQARFAGQPWAAVCEMVVLPVAILAGFVAAVANPPTNVWFAAGLHVALLVALYLVAMALCRFDLWRRGRGFTRMARRIGQLGQLGAWADAERQRWEDAPPLTLEDIARLRLDPRLAADHLADSAEAVKARLLAVESYHSLAGGRSKR